MFGLVLHHRRSIKILSLYSIGEVLVRFGLFWFGSSRSSFFLVQFRFCMLCSVVQLDLLCNYVAFSPFQVVFSCSCFSRCLDRLGCLMSFKLLWVVSGCWR